MWNNIDFWISFNGFGGSPGVLFTFGKEGKLQENKQKEEKQKKRNSAGKEAVLFNSNTPVGLQSRPRADLSCLRQYIRPGPAKIDVCEYP